MTWCKGGTPAFFECTERVVMSPAEKGQAASSPPEYSDEVVQLISQNLQRLQEMKGHWSNAAARMPPTEPDAKQYRRWAAERYAEVDDVTTTITQLAMLVPSALYAEQPDAARSLLRAGSAFLVECDELREWPHSRFDEATTSFAEIERAYAPESSSDSSSSSSTE